MLRLTVMQMKALQDKDIILPVDDDVEKLEEVVKVEI